MKQNSRPFLQLFLLLFVVAALMVPASGPLAASKDPLQNAIEELGALAKDQSRNTRRDLWLNLEKKFSALARKSKGDAAAKASFYVATARQELSRRSFATADYKEAAKLFASVAAKYPKSSFAPESLHKQAEILAYRLKDYPASRAVLEKLTKDYPRYGNMAEAKKLFADVSQEKSSESSPAAQKQAASSVTLKNVRWESKGQKAVVTLELDGSASFDHKFLPPDPSKKEPGKLYLDIVKALPANTLKSGMAPKGLVVSRIRTGKTATGTRVTLECEGAQCYLVSTPKGQPQIIQIEISRKEDISGGISVASGAKTADKGKSTAAKGATGTDKIMAQLGLTVQTILLDAGHGGTDPGAQSSELTEKNFTLSMAKRIGALLQKEGFTVLYTRSGDKFISLQDRPDFANSKKADLFISIHVNANTKSSVRGLETYYLDEAKSQNAVTVAARENGVPAKNINDLQFILTDLMLSTKLKESRHLANCIHKGILQQVRAAKLSTPDNGVRSAPFYVLMGARMPAILVEFGYITNAEDLKNLKTDAFLQKQAEGVVRGIVQYKKELAQAIQKK